MVWNRTQFGSVKRQKLQLLNVLNKLAILLESRLLTFEESFLKLSSLNELESVQHLEETMWRQRHAPFGSTKDISQF